MANIIRLSKDKFLETFKFAPRPAVSLIIKNPSGEFLLAKRSYQPLKGLWYLPGSFIYKNEHLFDCAVRVGKRELGIDIAFEQFSPKGFFENIYSDSRGHVIELIYEAILTTEQIAQMKPVEEIKMLKEIPKEEMYSGHDKILKHLGYK
ncbi:MAG: NUDIX domain-containing protein [Candidatus Levyibacteriota bacterium]